jgi:hypothetical protein
MYLLYFQKNYYQAKNLAGAISPKVFNRKKFGDHSDRNKVFCSKIKKRVGVQNDVIISKKF